ncbi:MAG: glycine--tRNA ligase subunit beta [Anaerolineae bacterium]|nr:glycine--tRNA ligase subunit beta [Chloroflexota bacterium]MCO6445568.1 glycine--tRNA ligase subunit beta [Anaerolineae bacterium]MDL1916788.1 glycine--tRNA ligase subunit beta [Anaerolineae bacterium CFX4]RIK22728.1 MAG: glycine--tRNA ligase subunit alpha/beta [Chloroflexota bacterium]GIK29386.1 MAG: glycine--tRNA ligase [Chloroflexota bacterium]
MTGKPLNFQQVILKLHEFWAAHDCVIWEPYNVQVGAGTGNPATLLRVLGPEPWRVAYVEPSVRPDDGRYGENPNRMQKYYQYQVILKPDPGNPQELYLQSLEALGIDPREHDIRFVEDNWESPALGAWGLGWEVWLDGQEITQFTYFQQAGGLELNPPAVEITYGVERIVLALQGRDSAWDIEWLGDLQYRDMMLQDEIDHCRYYFDLADVENLREVYDIYEGEHKRSLEAAAIIPAYDYILKCSHLFNVLDARGAVGVTERASYFRRMRDMTRNIAKAYVAQRESLGFPILKMAERWAGPALQTPTAGLAAPTAPADVLIELGIEELPAQDVDDAQAQLEQSASRLFEELRLANDGVRVMATPRRLVIHARGVQPVQPNQTTIEKGPPAERAFNADGTPTKAAEGFARSRGIDVSALTVEDVDGGKYVMARVERKGRPAIDVLAEALPAFVGAIKFPKSMRWNETNQAFSRPLRWILALFGQQVIPFAFAGVASGSVTRGIRPYGSPEQAVADVDAYFAFVTSQGVVLDREARRAAIAQQVRDLAAEVGGVVPDDPGLLQEVVNLIEVPTAVRGSFDPDFLTLPRDVLINVMRNKQRYFAVQSSSGELLPYFITIRNGDREHVDLVQKGNEHVLTARFSDARFFYRDDVKAPLDAYLMRLSTLTFQEKLGSMLDKSRRIERLVPAAAQTLATPRADVEVAKRAAQILKADLATRMVVEMTSLQGVMGREYARLGGEPEPVAAAIYEHWLPRSADDDVPASPAGVLLALLDRLDSLVGLFGVGLAPKSTADPYGLRRAALGIIQILAHHEIDLDLSGLIQDVAAVQPVAISAETRAQVEEFIAGRLRVWLSDRGFAADVISAVLAETSTNPYRALVNVEQLTEWVAGDGWADILDSFARCVRITRGEPQRYNVNEAKFVQDEERELHLAYQQSRATLNAHADVDSFLSSFAPMVPVVRRFFGDEAGKGVLVNTDDADIRRNRIALLQAISAMQAGRADLSALAGF